jgi:hypothetical protein
MKALLIAIMMLAATPAWAQTTTTNCNVNGQQVNCTSNTTPSFSESMDKFNKDMGEMSANLAQGRAMTDRAKTNVEYCRENPSGVVTTNNGITKSCKDEIAYVTASCNVHKWRGICKNWKWMKPADPQQTQK